VPALQYAPDDGPVPLREELAAFLSAFFGHSIPIDRITTTGGASQNFAVVLSTFTDPKYTRAAFVIEPTYYLACRMLDDAGLKVHGVPDGDGGADVAELRRRMEEMEDKARRDGNDRPVSYSRRLLINYQIVIGTLRFACIVIQALHRLPVCLRSDVGLPIDLQPHWIFGRVIIFMSWHCQFRPLL
jgi:hypothetical protein